MVTGLVYFVTVADELILPGSWTLPDLAGMVVPSSVGRGNYKLYTGSDLVAYDSLYSLYLQGEIFPDQAEELLQAIQETWEQSISASSGETIY